MADTFLRRNFSHRLFNISENTKKEKASAQSHEITVHII